MLNAYEVYFEYVGTFNNKGIVIAHSMQEAIELCEKEKYVVVGIKKIEYNSLIISKQ